MIIQTHHSPYYYVQVVEQCVVLVYKLVYSLFGEKRVEARGCDTPTGAPL